MSLDTITEIDRALINQMVGPEMFEKGYPETFLDEYLIRARMLSAAGKTGGLGSEAIMQLLRDFNVSKPPPPELVEVKDWRDIATGAVIYFRGDRGRFVQALENGRVLVKMDGQRAQWEVNRNEITLRTTPVLADYDDPIEDEAVIIPAAEAAVNVPVPEDSPQEIREPTEEELLFQQWVAVDPLTKVIAEIDGEEVEGEFVTIDGNEITLYINEEAVSLEASKVQLPVQA